MNLYANGTFVESADIKEENGNWTYTFTGLPKYGNGALITYSVSETPIDEFSSSVSGFDITNTYDPEITSVNVQKIWDDSDDQDGVRPAEITVNLYRNGALMEGKTLSLNSSNNWQGSFENLIKYESGSGNTPYTYTVGEATQTGYTATIEGSMDTGFIIKNSHTPETISISGEKKWVDEGYENQRPESILIYLYADGELKDISAVSPDSDGSWKFEFSDLPKYSEGVEVQYTIGEVSAEGYQTSVSGDMYSGFVVTNTYEKEETPSAPDSPKGGGSGGSGGGGGGSGGGGSGIYSPEGSAEVDTSVPSYDTGDTTPVFLYVFMMLASLFSLCLSGASLSGRMRHKLHSGRDL